MDETPLLYEKCFMEGCELLGGIFYKRAVSHCRKGCFGSGLTQIPYSETLAMLLMKCYARLQERKEGKRLYEELYHFGGQSWNCRRAGPLPGPTRNVFGDRERGILDFFIICLYLRWMILSAFVSEVFRAEVEGRALDGRLLPRKADHWAGFFKPGEKTWSLLRFGAIFLEFGLLMRYFFCVGGKYPPAWPQARLHPRMMEMLFVEKPRMCRRNGKILWAGGAWRSTGKNGEEAFEEPPVERLWTAPDSRRPEESWLVGLCGTFGGRAQIYGPGAFEGLQACSLEILRAKCK